jgi:hypothetical protein
MKQVVEQMRAACSEVVKTVSGLFVALLFILMLSPDAFSKEVIGWVENVRVTPGEVSITAKIDTGADSSSLHCECKNFLRDDERWVKFLVTDVDGEQVAIEKKVVRTTTIKRHFGNEQKRDVIRLGLCIGGQYEETDVSLVDRSGFQYDMLIGRDYLKGKFVIDPAQKFTVEPHCETAK